MATSRMQGGHNISGDITDVNVALAGNNFSVGGNLLINTGGSQTTEECLTALFLSNPVDDRAAYLSFHGQPSPGTCSWIDKNDVYRSWGEGDQPSSKLLWLSAGAGMGKTMLSIHMSQQLEAACRAGKNMLVLYFFCDGRDEKRNTAVCILRGLIFQMIQQQSNLVKALLTDYKVQKKNLFKPHSLEALWRIFETLIRESTARRIYCLIDGLDECERRSMEHFLKKVRGYFGSINALGGPGLPSSAISGPNITTNSQGQAVGAELRMILVSRREPACLAQELNQFPEVTFTSSSNQHDPGQKYEQGLDIFIDQKAEEVCQATGAASDSVGSVSSALKTGDGSFLWVGLAVNRLKKSKSSSFADQLNNLPANLEQMYCETLRQVPKEWEIYVAALLRWVALAVRPLTFAELRVALNLSTRATFEHSHLKQMLTLCDTLLNVSNGQVALSHQSIQDLLVKPTSSLYQDTSLRAYYIEWEFVHAELANACVSYLENGALIGGPVRTQPTGKDTVDSNRLANFPLLAYAIHNWSEHARLAPLGKLNFSRPFFVAGSAVLRSWWQSYWISRDSAHVSAWMAPEPFTLLHIAAYCGIFSLVMYVENQGQLLKEMSMRDNHTGRPLDYSIENTHFQITQYLVECGALQIPQDKKDFYMEPNLHVAARCNDAQAIGLFLDHGDNTERVHQLSFSNPLHVMKVIGLFATHPSAAAYGFKQPGDKFNRTPMFSCGSGETAMHIASSFGNDLCIEMLASRGGNINAVTSGGWTPMHNAAWYGKTTVMSLLLDLGADPHCVCKDGRTILHCAAQGPNDPAESLRWGVAALVPLEAKTKGGKTALHLASREGNEECTKVLLGHRASVTTQESNGNTPLHLAVSKGHRGIAAYLMDCGADRMATNNEGIRCLDLAGKFSSEFGREVETYIPKDPSSWYNDDSSGFATLTKASSYTSPELPSVQMESLTLAPPGISQRTSPGSMPVPPPPSTPQSRLLNTPRDTQLSSRPRAISAASAPSLPPPPLPMRPMPSAPSAPPTSGPGPALHSFSPPPALPPRPLTANDSTYPAPDAGAFPNVYTNRVPPQIPPPRFYPPPPPQHYLATTPVQTFAPPPGSYSPPQLGYPPYPTQDIPPSYGQGVSYGQSPFLYPNAVPGLAPGYTSGVAFAPPPALSGQQVRKSRSFMDLTIMGRRIL